VIGATVLGEKLTPTGALGSGLNLAGILLRRWVRKPRDRIGDEPCVRAG
jgi:hypothetical protein